MSFSPISTVGALVLGGLGAWSLALIFPASEGSSVSALALPFSAFVLLASSLTQLIGYRGASGRERTIVSTTAVLFLASSVASLVSLALWATTNAPFVIATVGTLTIQGLVFVALKSIRA